MSNRHGHHWIRDSKRRAIYARDGFRCLWCTRSVEPGVDATLDHFLPRAMGGGNTADNLLTACKPCNDSRQDMPAIWFGSPDALSRIVEQLAIPLARGHSRRAA
jgi:5-methylcytosine-specific restriction endonuclease McrA